jgi:hypothetical protein
MSARANSARARRLAAVALAAALAPVAYAQAPEVQRARPAPSSAPAPTRMVIQIYAEKVTVRADPSPRATVLAELQKGTRVEATARRGNWYRVTLADGRSGWIERVEGKVAPNFAVDDTPGVMLARPTAPGEAAPAGEAPAAAPSGPVPDDRIVQQRPMGRPLEPVIPIIDPKQVPPPSPLLPTESVPIPDRWRLVDQLKLVNNRWYDPYNANTIKGDRPIWGEDWFFEFTGISDTVLEWRRIPTPSAAQSTVNPQSNDVFTRGRQFTFEQTLVASFSILKGNTTFKPPEIEFRFTPVFNYNYNDVQEVRVLNIDPTKGTTRNDSFLGIQELFVDYEYRIVNDRYDFDTVRVGIQPFISDFRGFLFQDEPVGIRFFGTRDNNQWQYNAGWFRRLEKDTNSGLNDLGKPLRDDDVFYFNLYRQDFWVPGFTLQGTLIYNRNAEDSGQFFDNNGFQVRPAVAGTALPRSYDVWYLGANGDGHFGAWNLTASAYWAIGKNDRNAFSNESADINAFFAAAEVSRDFDWIRVRGSGLFATGDKDAFDGRENGFDAILENPQFAGADTSFWVRQGIPLIGGGGVLLKGRNSVLPSLRSSKDQGQSNFVNPGLALLGIGADFDLMPQLRATANLNQLWFSDTSSLSTLRNQGNIDRNIGTDISAALTYRPYFTQNVVLNVSAAALVPGSGWKQLFRTSGETPYSILANLVLTF